MGNNTFEDNNERYDNCFAEGRY